MEIMNKYLAVLMNSILLLLSSRRMRRRVENDYMLLTAVKYY